MPKMCDRKLELAATKSRVSTSSLSKVKIGVELPTSVVARISSRRLLSLFKLSMNTAKFSAKLQMT